MSICFMRLAPASLWILQLSNLDPMYDKLFTYNHQSFSQTVNVSLLITVASYDTKYNF